MYLAEYLPRVETVVIAVEDAGGELTLAVDKAASSLTVGGQVVALPLAPNTAVALVNLGRRDGTITVALKVEATQTQLPVVAASFMNYSTPSLASSAFVPRWLVRDLKNKTAQRAGKNQFEFECALCRTPLVSGDTHVFFDLPSELWLEMMEFWHCHKPHVNLGDLAEKLHFQGALKPGSEREVIVATSHLLVRRDRAGTIGVRDAACVCRQCHATLGHYVEELSHYDREMYFRLNKWALVLAYSGVEESYPPYLYVYNLLMERINLLAVRRFVINKSLLVWVINVGVNVATVGGVYHNALKVATRAAEHDDGDELELPPAIYEDFTLRLRDIAAQLPPAARRLNLKHDAFEVSFLPADPPPA